MPASGANVQTARSKLFDVNELTVTIENRGRQLFVLQDVSFSVFHGEKVCIIGKSGSGKSTLLEMLGLLSRPPRGAVFLEGTDLGSITNDERTALRRTKFGFVFQNFNLIEHYTALENVALPLRYAGVRSKAATQRALIKLAEVGLAQQAEIVSSKLSGGERQRVAIARATVNDPDVLFADEPTGSLDVTTGDTVLETLISKNAKKPRALIMVTHNPEYAARFERRLTLEAGRLV